MLSNDNPFVNKLFLKNFIKNKDINGLEESLKDISMKKNIDKDKLNYFLVKSLLNNYMFFELNEEIKDYLFYKAAYWASYQETKQKNRPKNFQNVSNKKNIRYFTTLIHSLISSIYVNNELTYEDLINSSVKKIKYDYELGIYLNFIFEISCIKRKRN